MIYTHGGIKTSVNWALSPNRSQSHKSLLVRDNNKTGMSEKGISIEFPFHSFFKGERYMSSLQEEGAPCLL